MRNIILDPQKSKLRCLNGRFQHGKVLFSWCQWGEFGYVRRKCLNKEVIIEWYLEIPENTTTVITKLEVHLKMGGVRNINPNTDNLKNMS